MKKALALAMTGVVALSMLSGCGSSSSTSTATATSTAAEATTEAAEATTEAADTTAEATDSAEAAAASSGVISTSADDLAAQPDGWTEADADQSVVIHTGTAFNTIVPFEMTGNDGIMMAEALYGDTLYKYDENGELEPWLATDYEIADDNMSATFTLRDDVYFTNGDKMTADDVAFSFNELIQDTEHIADSNISKWRDYVDNVEAVDDTHVKFNFLKEKPTLMYNLCLTDMFVIDKAAFEEEGYDEFWKSPVTTAPYVIESFDSANTILKLTLRTDENGWWGYDALNTYTNVKNITIQYSPEATTRVSSLQSGEVQVIDQVPTTDIDTLTAAGNTGLLAPAVQGTFLQLNVADGKIMSNPKIAQALSMCIDRQAIVDALLSGYGTAADWPCMKGQLGYESENGYVYDPEGAKAVLDESGYNGEEINFIFNPSTVSIGNELSQAIQSYAQAIGLNMTVTTLENAVYDEAREAGEFDVCLGNITDDGNMWWKISAEVIGQDRFNSGITNQTIMDLGTQMQTEMDPDKQDEILKQMYEIEMTDYQPHIFLYYPRTLTATAGNISGIQYHNLQMVDCETMVVNN